MSLEDITRQIADVFEGKNSGLGKTYKIDFGDRGCIFIDASSNPNTVSNEDNEADTAMVISLENWEKFARRDLSAESAVESGALRFKGDLRGAMALGSYMESQQ